MEKLHFEYPASQPIKQGAHLGVVGSGDLEVLLEPSRDHTARVSVTTSVDGFGKTWKLVMDRFFSRYQYAASIEMEVLRLWRGDLISWTNAPRSLSRRSVQMAPI